MTQPTAYSPVTDFSADEANAVAGRSTVRTVQLDGEFTALAQTLSEILTNLSILQRDDTELNDGIVKPHSLSAATLVLLGSAGFSFNAAGLPWLTATVYAAGQIVTEGTGTYVCAEPHTSGTFATDLAADKWVTIFDTVSLVASAVTNTPAGDISGATVQAALNELDTEKLAKAMLTAKGSLYVASAAGTPADHPVGSDFTVLRARDGATRGVEWVSVGGSRVVGCDCKNNASTPNTQFDLDADEVHLRNTAGATISVINPGAALVNNVLTAGPAANGRDQSGAFSAGSWVHFYWIYDPSTSTLATISSATAPPTGPTLPTNYTHWAYAGAVRLNGSSVLLKTRIRGSRAFYEASQSALSGGTATSSTSVNVAAVVPPNARSYSLLNSGMVLTTDGGGNATFSGVVEVVSGSSYWQSQSVQLTGFSATTAQVFPSGSVCEVPNVGQAFRYYTTVTAGSSPQVSYTVQGYTVPNGGE